MPALLCGFAVWGMWGIITVQMLNLGFPFTQAELFTLTAIAGIAGATMRIPASFLIRLAGGRNTIFLTTAMLLAPAIGTGIVLQHKDWPLWAFQLMALWSAWAAATSPVRCPTSAPSSRSGCRARRSA
jgi:NNP family nitrate/nitrite transporter-like MFS transporter